MTDTVPNTLADRPAQEMLAPLERLGTVAEDELHAAEDGAARGLTAYSRWAKQPSEFQGDRHPGAVARRRQRADVVRVGVARRPPRARMAPPPRERRGPDRRHDTVEALMSGAP